MTKSKAFRTLSLSFISGITLASFCWPHMLADFYLSLILTATLIIIFAFYREKKILIVGLAVLFFISGIYSVNIKLSRLNKLSLEGEGKEFSGKVIIVKEPEIKGEYQRLTVESFQYDKFLINTNLYADYFYGDVLDVNCRLEIPRNKITDEVIGRSVGGGLFDYKLYLAKDNIYYLCKSSKIEKIGENQGNFIYKYILTVKNKVGSSVDKLIPSPESGLLFGLILGGDDKLLANIADNFSRTGLTHIVAVSGYNVTIVAEYLMLLGIFLGLWRRQAFWLAIIGVFLFVLMVGFPSSAVRAGVMGSLLLWAMKNGRLANSQNAVLCSASFMLLLNPMLLRWDVGFQLSFLATLGIIYVYPILERYLINKDKFYTGTKKIVSETLLLTFSAQVFVLPIILYNFGSLSLISPLANVLVLPIIPITMMLGFMMIFFAFFVPPVGTVFSWLTYLPLKYETSVINFLAGLKYSSVEWKGFPWWAVAAWYIILFMGLKYAWTKSNL